MRRWLAAAGAALSLVSIPSAHALSLPPTLGPGGCYDPTQSNADFEAYGPTDVNAQAGNGHVTVNENAAGTITVFKYPNPSLYNQIKYFAVSRDANGQVHTRFPNEGSLAGIGWRTAGGSGFAWLRDWHTSQTWDSPDLPVPVTTYTAPGGLGLSVTVIDLAPPGGDAFVRELWVHRSRHSPVRSAWITEFANFNPVATHIPLLPIEDWCMPGSDQHSAYEPALHSIVSSWSGTDQATGRATSVAVAVGFAGPDSSHEVGQDGYDPAPDGSGGADGYDQARTPPYKLGGDSVADGQTTQTLTQDVRFDRRGRAAARVVMAGGVDRAAALSALAAARQASFARQMAAVRSDWRRFLSRTRLPAHAPRRVTDVAKRSLISLRLAHVDSTGAIVASVNTQGPYGEDWIRDGAFLNYTLDENGFAGWVTSHNLFYTRVQASPTNPSALRPSGNWAMASYSDGVDGAPIPWEIDETGLGIWTLYDHSTFLKGAAASSYLAAVYPAIVRSADFLTTCADPTNGMQCTANEDDNYTPSQSLHGAEAVYLGLRSAIAAAHAIGDNDPRLARWQARLDALGAAIDKLYEPARHAYGEGNAGGNAYNLDYSDGGWLLWPVQYKPYDDPKMQGEAAAVEHAMDASLAGPRGQYESKALLGLAYAYAHDPAGLARLRTTLAYMASTLTTPTGLFGESWERLANGHIQAVQDMPHVWEHALFYMAALQIDGAAPYRFARSERCQPKDETCAGL
jgi:hypothetical protein